MSIRKVLKSIINKAGYSICGKESIIPKDLRGQVYNPLYAKYYARKHNFLIDADFKKCIAINRFSFEKTGSNPFINTLTDYIENGSISYSGSRLEDFYNTFAPKNVADLFDLEGKLHANLVKLSAAYFVPPWENADMESKRKFREKYVKYENRQRGKALSLEHGRGCFGPVSEEFGQLKIKTLVALTKSIANKGYLRGNGPGEDIEATVLVKNRDFKYLINDGNHRIAVLSALGYKTAPLRVLAQSIPAFIYRDEVYYWPNVKNDLYT